MPNWRQWEQPQTLAGGLRGCDPPLSRNLTDERLQEAMRRLNLGRSVLYKLIQRYRQRPQTSSLLPLKRGRGRDIRVLNRDQEEYYITVSHSGILFDAERPSMAALVRETRRRFFERQLSPPDYRTVQRRVETLDLRFALKEREGSKRAREKCGPVAVSSLVAERPMDLVQIDHTLMDIEVVDREQRRSIGRPWLTLAIDVATRAVIGFSVSLEGPSALSVSLLLSHAVLPKDRWLADRELHNLDWPMGGLPRRIHVDNGKDLESIRFQGVMQLSGPIVVRFVAGSLDTSVETSPPTVH